MSFNDQIIEEFRANGGVVGGPFEGSSLLLLHTIGARSGKERVTPLVYRGEGEQYLIVASKGGAPEHPDWYFNLKANPSVSIEVGEQTLEATATFLDGDERNAAYERLASQYPFFADYELKADRVIPVIALSPNRPGRA